MEILNWFLIFAAMISGYLPVLRFRGHKYFIFFAVNSLIDPLYAFFLFTHVINNFYYIPFALSIIISFLPGKFRELRVLTGITALIFSLHFINDMVALRIIAAMLSTGILVFLIKSILEIVKKEEQIYLFIVLLALNILIHGLSIFIYFEYIGIYTKYYSLLLLFDITTFVLIALTGPNKYIKVHYKHNLESEELHPEVLKKVKDVYTNFLTNNIDSVNSNGFHDNLTKRELEIFFYLCEGLTNEEIAKKIFRTRDTVETHLQRIKEKLQFENMAELRRYARSNHVKFTNQELPTTPSKKKSV